METRKVAASQIPADVAGARTAGQTARAGGSASSGAAAQSGNSSAKSGINVAVSPKARELADARKRAFDIAKATPDIREDRVAEIKRQIQAGTYQADPEKIADGIGREAILEYMAESDGKSRV